jgi:hypothetical protein
MRNKGGRCARFLRLQSRGSRARANPMRRRGPPIELTTGFYCPTGGSFGVAELALITPNAWFAPPRADAAYHQRWGTVPLMAMTSSALRGSARS